MFLYIVFAITGRWTKRRWTKITRKIIIIIGNIRQSKPGLKPESTNPECTSSFLKSIINIHINSKWHIEAKIN